MKYKESKNYTCLDSGAVVSEVEWKYTALNNHNSKSIWIA